MKDMRFRPVTAVIVAVCFLALADDALACRFRRSRCVRCPNVCCQPVYCQPSQTANASSGSVAWQPKDEFETELGSPPKSASDVTVVSDQFAL